jgi:hypothetical protein
MTFGILKVSSPFLLLLHLAGQTLTCLIVLSAWLKASISGNGGIFITKHVSCLELNEVDIRVSAFSQFQRHLFVARPQISKAINN